MIGNFRVDMAVDRRLVAQHGGLGDQANIGIEKMLLRIAVVIRFIGAHRLFIPLAGKDALAADGVEAAPNAANAREKIDKGQRKDR